MLAGAEGARQRGRGDVTGQGIRAWRPEGSTPACPRQQAALSDAAQLVRVTVFFFVKAPERCASARLLRRESFSPVAGLGWAARADAANWASGCVCVCVCACRSVGLRKMARDSRAKLAWARGKKAEIKVGFLWAAHQLPTHTTSLALSCAAVRISESCQAWPSFWLLSALFCFMSFDSAAPLRLIFFSFTSFWAL